MFSGPKEELNCLDTAVEVVVVIDVVLVVVVVVDVLLVAVVDVVVDAVVIVVEEEVFDVVVYEGLVTSTGSITNPLTEI